MSGAPLFRPLVVATIPAGGLAVEVVADDAERAALAALNDVESVERLTARLEARLFGRDEVVILGRLEAEATRLCGVTLEPFVETVREEVEMRFAPEDPRASEDDDEDRPDPIVGGVVDLGAVVSEFFTLGLDPHPRKPGATFDGSAASDPADKPFAALGKLKPGGGKGY